jgi:hypothetical protein
MTISKTNFKNALKDDIIQILAPAGDQALETAGAAPDVFSLKMCSYLDSH